jgi:hypothetical protein
MGPGDHVAAIYASDEEREGLVAAFLGAAIDEGARALYADGVTADSALEALRRAGYDVDALRTAGQVTVLDPDTAAAASGGLSPDRCLSFLGGQFATRALHGDYEITVRRAGEAKTAAVGLRRKGERHVRVALGSSPPGGAVPLQSP